MRPGRIKHKARARHRKLAVTCAGVSALTVMGGTAAFATTDGGRWDPHSHGTASVDNGGSAAAEVDQAQEAFTSQRALANTGGNDAVGITGNLNLGDQSCNTDVTDGNISNVNHDNSAGNTGGDCTNDGHGREHRHEHGGDPHRQRQRPELGAQHREPAQQRRLRPSTTAPATTPLTAEDGSASVHNGGSASLYVGQSSVDRDRPDGGREHRPQLGHCRGHRGQRRQPVRQLDRLGRQHQLGGRPQHGRQHRWWRVEHLERVEHGYGERQHHDRKRHGVELEHHVRHPDEQWQRVLDQHGKRQHRHEPLTGD